MRDSQRQKVYDWESVLPDHGKHTIPFDQCRNLIADVWAAYRPGQHLPHLADGRGTRVAHGSHTVISLPLWARTKVVVLHETTHSLCYKDVPHGPEFVALFIELLVRWGGYNRTEIRKFARARRIKVAPWTAIEKPSARTRAAKHLNRPRACKHEWEVMTVKTQQVTQAGLTTVSRAICYHCKKGIG